MARRDDIFKLTNKIEKLPDGKIYEGTMLGKEMHGKGLLKLKDGSKYEGDFRSGKREGFGVLKNKENLEIYRGNWKNDKYHGYGKLCSTNPNNKKEIKPNDFSESKGAFIRYEGEFCEGFMDGQGIITFYDNSRV